MSRFLSKNTASLSPYIPGEQPQDKAYIKLNTNECPYAPSALVAEAMRNIKADDLRLYPDPNVASLQMAMASNFSLEKNQVFVGGGSDEVLAYIFMAFFNKRDKVYFADITYGFYEIYANLCELKPIEIPLNEDYTINIEDYFGLDGHIVIANPNAPTTLAINPDQIELILQKNPERLVVIDEAYIDFSNNKSVVNLINKYDNLVVVQTYSKSRALAGMRIGCALANAEIIAGINRIKFSFNPYNLDRISIDVGIASTKDKKHLQDTIAKIIKTRESSTKQLSNLGFKILPSETNFLFASHAKLSGEALYLSLKDKGILVRYFSKKRTKDFIRITIGTDAEMTKLVAVLKEILNETI